MTSRYWRVYSVFAAIHHLTGKVSPEYIKSVLEEWSTSLVSSISPPTIVRYLAFGRRISFVLDSLGLSSYDLLLPFQWVRC